MARTAVAAAMSLLLCGDAEFAGAAELPMRKSGLWEIKIKLTGGVMPTAVMRHCTDDKIDSGMSTMFNPVSPDPCPKRDVQKTAERYTIDSVCRAGEKSITLHSDITGDFTTSYTVITETKTQEDESSSEPAVSNMTLEGKYLGACRPGEKPGDVTFAGGMRVNVKDLENFRNTLKK